MLLSLLLAFTLLPVLPAAPAQADDLPAEAPQIPLPPADSTYASNADARFYVRATSVDGGYLSYTWHRSTGYPAPQDKNAHADAIMATGEEFDPASGELSLKADGSRSILTVKTPTVEGTAYYYYWVTVTNHKDTNGDGDTLDPGETNERNTGLAEVKVVARTLFDSVRNGDFQAYGGSTPTLDNYPPSAGYWNTTHEGTPDGRAGSTGKQIEIGPGGGSAGYVVNAPNATNAAELSAFTPSTLYQEIATVPGKVYEWQIDHGARNKNNSNADPDVIAVVIGAAVNEESDYADMVVTDYWNKVSPSEFNGKSIDTTKSSKVPSGAFAYPYGTSPTEVAPTLTLPINGGDYAYGVNTNTHFNAIVSQVLQESGLQAADYNAENGSTFNNVDRAYATTYGGKPYYVFISAAQRNGSWYVRSGSYTVPAGQGTTVFGFVSVSSPGGTASGNILDNITFASAAGLDAEQDATYSGETSLSTPTKAGFAYALAEVRGSSVNELAGLAAWYDPDGAGAAAAARVAPTDDLGAGGWYTTDSDTGTGGTAFASGGTLVFHDLVPGRTYRIIGIPIAAINSGLHTNESPGNVLDNGYYRDVRIRAMSAGGDGALSAWDMEPYEEADADDMPVKRVRLTLKNLNAQADYALLATESNDSDAPDVAQADYALLATESNDSDAPDVSDALPSTKGTKWTSGLEGTIVFEGLLPSVSYYLVARPSGYTELGFADAAFDDEGALVALKVDTPDQTVTDLDASGITRSATGTQITIAAAATASGMTYAVADPATGALGTPQAYNGAALAFSGLNPTQAYQVVCRAGSGSWLAGVRVYPYADLLALDYEADAVRSTASGVAGFIPATVEYAVHANDSARTWLVGEGSGDVPGVWRRAAGTALIELAEAGMVESGKLSQGSPATSIFDALDALASAGGFGTSEPSATVTYRYAADEGYAGSFVRPAHTLEVPARPAAPVLLASAGVGQGYFVDYPSEELAGGTAALEWAPSVGGSWTPLAAGAKASFGGPGGLGWNGAVAQGLRLRYPAVTAPAGSEAFASFAAAVVLKARPVAPTGLTAALVDAADATQGIYLGGFEAGVDYEYRRGDAASWASLDLTEAEAEEGGSLKTMLPYGGAEGDYDVRFAATAEAPASLGVTVSSPLNVSSFVFDRAVYGEATVAHAISINNIVTEDVALEAYAVALDGVDSDLFTLNSPGWQTVPKGGANTAWELTPVADLPAGSYSVTVLVNYTYGEDSKPYTAKAAVYLTVDRADWPVGTLEASTTDVSASGFTAQVTGAPAGARLSYQLGSGAWSDAAAEPAVDGQGTTSHSFANLKPATRYAVKVQVAGDPNHNESAVLTPVTAYTAYATPVVADVLTVGYSDEQLHFNSGVTAADYLVKVVGGPSDGATLANLASLSALAEAGDFALSVSRRAQGSYPASEAATLPVTGRAPAPAGAVDAPSTDDSSADGSITLAGTFQYRPSQNGANLTEGWTLATGMAQVAAGRYELRYRPTSSAFASKIALVQVRSQNPTVTLHTKTAAPSSGTDPVLPSYLTLPSGWNLVNDPSRTEGGEYDHAYKTSPLLLPAEKAVSSTSHVFKGWYDETGYNNGAFDGGTAQTVTPSGGDEPKHHDYYALWAQRPRVATVKGIAPVVDAATATLGLDPDHPALLSVHLPASDVGASQPGVAFDHLVLEGQSLDETAKLYSDAAFSKEEPDSAIALIAWGAAPTRLYLKTVSADDDTTPVYYAIDVYATRTVSFTAQQDNGARYTKTSTGIRISLSETSVTGLAASNITLTDGTGHATKGALSSSGLYYMLAVSNVRGGTVTLAIADWPGYKVATAGATVELCQDTTPPSVTMQVGTASAFGDFVNRITFGLFFKDTVEVCISAGDGDGKGSGVASIEYLVREDASLSEEEALGADGWQTGTLTGVVGVYPYDSARATFDIDANSKAFLYARATDAAGNTTVVNSDGVVVYTGSTGVATNISYTKLSLADKQATVALNGNTIRDITTTISDETHTLVRGTDYLLSEDGATITFKGSWLESLEWASYNLTVSYNPLGETYVEASGNEAPPTTNIVLFVQGATSTLTLSSSPSLVSGATYGTNNVTLYARVAALGTPEVPPTGWVDFYGKKDGNERKILGYIELDSTGRAALPLTLDAGSYELSARYMTGDLNYASGPEDAFASPYVVAKAHQTGLAIEDANSGETDGSTVSGTTVTATHGDAALSFTATGGSGTGAYSWENSDPDIASVAAGEPDFDEATVTLKKAGSTTVTLTRAGDANHFSGSVSFDLTVNEEEVAPLPGGTADPAGGVLTAAGIGQTSATLSWTAATDNLSTPANLTYYLYRSNTNNIGDLEDCVANGGTPLNGAAGTKNLTTHSLTGLTSGEPSWYNVVVADEAGNRAAYTQMRVVPRLAVSYTATQVGGKNGRQATAGILITFDKEVRDLHLDSVTITDAAGLGADPNGPVTDNGDESLRTWYVPVRFGTTAEPNGEQVSLTIADWTTANGRGYDLTDGTGPGERTQPVTVYGPVAWEPPNAALDYVNERLTNLAVGGTYKFANTSHGYNGDRTIGADGIYDHIPFSELDTDLLIKRVGVPETVSNPADDDFYHLDSKAQTIEIPERPAAPALALAQPQDANEKGGFTVTTSYVQVNSADRTYEYISAEDFAELDPSVPYDASKWEQVSGATATGLEPGAYYARVKAVAVEEGADGAFASDKTFFYIHDYHEIDFTALEGYTSVDVPAQNIEPEDESGHTITNVALKSDDGPARFVVGDRGDGDLSTFDVRPVTGLTRGIYTATLEITCDGGGGSSEISEIHLTFIVHPTAAFVAGDAGIVASSTVSSKSTDRLTLTFAYPIDLAYGDVVIGGAAHKDTAWDGFAVASGDKKTYTVALAALPANKTGDDIEVTVNLGSHPEFEYWRTAEEAASLNGTADVSIPRAITSAHPITVPSGYATGVVQFTLDHMLTPVPVDSGLLWDLDLTGTVPYTGPVELRASGIDGAADAEVTAVYFVTADEGYTYRVFVTVTQGGTAEIGIPSWGIDFVEVKDGLSGGDILWDVAYFLNADGYNYLTDIESYQVLSELDAAPAYPYAAPALELRTNKEWNEGATAQVRVYGSDDTEGSLLEEGRDYTLTGGGNRDFHFSDGGGAVVHLANQLVLTLKQDWTRENGVYRITAVLNDGNSNEGDGFVTNTFAQAVVTVREILPTRSLTVVDGPGGTAPPNGSKAHSAYGIPADTPTTQGAFAPGTHVMLEAGAAATGYRFGSWSQQPEAVIADLPQGATGEFLMPDADVTLTARYVDGVAPETTVTPADGSWIQGAAPVTLGATDCDVTKGGDGQGAVAELHYTVDGNEHTVSGPSATFTLPDEGPHTVSYYAVDETGNREQTKTATLGRDDTPPAASVTLRGVKYETFSYPVGFPRFYKGASGLSFAVAGADPAAGGNAGSGVEKVEYLLDDGSGHAMDEPLFATPEAAAADTSTAWVTVQGTGGSVSIPNSELGTYHLFVRVIDEAGNVSVSCTTGFVYYADAEQGDDVVSYNRFSTVGAQVQVVLNGNTVASVADDTGPLDPFADYAVAGDTVTLASAYLDGFPASEEPLSLSVGYAPQGVAYPASPLVGNDAPAPTTFELEVDRAVPAVALSADPQGSGTYGENNTELAVEVTGEPGFEPTGTVELYDGQASLGSFDLEADDAPTDGIASLRKAFTIGAGTHELCAVYSGDTIYEDAADTLGNYAVGKASQDVPVLSGAAIVDGKVTRTYGDAPFTLEAEGGAGTGDLVWRIVGSGIAVVDDDGTVTPISIGTASITVRRAADANYNESPRAQVTLEVTRRTVSITGVAAADRPYDATTVAQISGTPTLVNLAPGDEGAVTVDTSAATAAFASAGAGIGKQVTFAGFALDGAHASNYTLAGQPGPVTASVTKALPAWDAQSLVAGPIPFGGRVAHSQPSGDVRGVTGAPLAGTLVWAPEVDTQAIPGLDSEGLDPFGYGYAVRFTPTDTANYQVRDGIAALSVTKADPYLRGGNAPRGSVLFSAGSGAASHTTLADSTVSGEVVFSLGGVETALDGTWEWDTDENGVIDASDDSSAVSYPSEGIQHPKALFTPSDERVKVLQATADLPVHTVRTEVLSAPAIQTAAYGDALSKVGIDTAAAAVQALPASGGQAADISAQGTWAWKSPSALLTSTTGTQQAVLVFTPASQVDWANIVAGGYAAAEVAVTVPVGPAAPRITSVGTLPVIRFGTALDGASAGLATSGYAFSGVAAFGHGELAGTLVFDDGSVVPGSAGHEASADATGTSHSVAADGVYFAAATFVPDASNPGIYAPLSLCVEVGVSASAEAVADLASAASEAGTVVLPVLALAEENYEPSAVARFNAALDAVKAATAASAPLLTQARAQELLAELQAAEAALVHVHTVLENSAASGPLTEKGTGVTVRVRGSFSSVTSVRLDSKELGMTPASATSQRLSLDGKAAGTLSAGSAVVALAPAFVDGLADGTHTIELSFADELASGSAQASFVIARPTEPGPKPGPDPKPDPQPDPEPKPDPDPSPDPAPDSDPGVVPPTGSGTGGGAGTGSGAGTGAGTGGSTGTDAYTPPGAPGTTGNDGDAGGPGGNDGSDEGTTGDEAAPMPPIAAILADTGLRTLLIAFGGLALVTTALCIAFFSRRRKRQDASG
jgi:hypothetical protein